MEQHEFITKAVAMWPLKEKWDAIRLRWFQAQTITDRKGFRDEYEAARMALIEALRGLGVIDDAIVRGLAADEDKKQLHYKAAGLFE